MSRTRVLATVAIALLATVSAVTPARGQSTEGLTVLRPLTGVTVVAGGYYHSCAVLTSGQARCWGDNVSGQLGNGSIGGGSLVATPVRNGAGTGPLNGVTAIAAASGHSCALLANRQVRCWGDNGSGQLGNGTLQPSGLPVTVLNPAGTGPLGNVAQISADGDSSCARLVNGQVRCWGTNLFGALGAGSGVASSPRPKAVVAVAGRAPLSGVTQIDTGWNGSCARTRAGRALCWGNNVNGQLGGGTDDDQSNRPVVVQNASGNAPLGGVRRVTAGDAHSCAVLEDGTGRCWGKNEFGQLGGGGTEPRPRPVAVVAETGNGRLRSISQIATGFDHTCARLANGQVRCWGHNADAEVGNGTVSPSVALPTVVRNRRNRGALVGTAQVQATGSHTCVRLQNGEARCWGWNDFGNLGNADDEDSPLPVVVLVATS
jgi:alpha-tubulin suppressor-like RCC1 family protein